MFKTKPLVLMISAVLILSACKDEKSPSQVLAKVNSAEITVHQLNGLLTQIPDATSAVKQQVLEQLIDQELLVQKASELKLDREPSVLQAIESAKRQILSQAAAERVLGKPEELKTADIERFYNENPALFAQRKNYIFTVFSIDKNAYNDTLIKELDKAGSAQQIKAVLGSQQVQFNESELKRTAEQLPLAMLTKFAGMQTGDILAMPEAGKMILLLLKESFPVPVAKENAAPLIKRYLQNDKAQADARLKIKALRDAAKIEYTQTAPKAETASAAATTDNGMKAGLKGLK